MKWIKVESEKDLPKGKHEEQRLHVKFQTSPTIIIFDKKRWVWQSYEPVLEENWKHIEWLDESIDQDEPNNGYNRLKNDQEGSLNDSDWKDMWYSNSKRTKLHSEIEEDIQWIEDNVEAPLLNKIKQLEDLIDKAKPSEECA